MWKRTGPVDPLGPELRHEVNKRLTLNLLIQGAAVHTHLSAHHLVADELDAIDNRLVDLYDCSIAGATVAYWKGLLPLLFGQPAKFWGRLHLARNPFCFHRFLRRHGKQLAKVARREAIQRGRLKRVPTGSIQQEVFLGKCMLEIKVIESPYIAELEAIAKSACHQIIGIPEDLLIASITDTPAWGNVRTPETLRGKMLMPVMVGWGGVDRIDGRLRVVAKAIFWPLLLHELIKGSMELICLHGMKQLSGEHYDVVMDYTEKVEYEVPMLQVGPVIYQRFLAVLPRNTPLAENVRKVATMDAIELEEFMFDMIEAPQQATDRLRKIL